MKDRLQQLRAQFAALRIDAFLLTFPQHLRYISAFTGSAGVGFISEERATLATDGRYASQVREQTRGWKVLITQGSLFEKLNAQKLLKPGMRVGFDGNTVLFAQYQALKKMFPRVKFLPKVDVVEKLAAVKDDTELLKIRRAVEITDTTFAEILPMVKPGVAELDLAAEISYRQRRHGAESDAFESIVASGERSALPHGRATSKKLASGDLLTLDFGAVYEGYHSDMTRTVAVGKLKPEAKKIYGVVRSAQQAALDSARAGMKARDLDAVARGVIRKAGYEKYFRHSLGHGIGLQIHEQPRISILSTAVLAPGNVITVEPGIYVPQLGGVRIEDDVIVGSDGVEILNRSPKELLVL
jgi:Xaa-Pro aminopeptidase